MAVPDHLLRMQGLHFLLTGSPAICGPFFGCQEVRDRDRRQGQSAQAARQHGHETSLGRFGEVSSRTLYLSWAPETDHRVQSIVYSNRSSLSARQYGPGLPNKRERHTLPRLWSARERSTPIRSQARRGIEHPPHLSRILKGRMAKTPDLQSLARRRFASRI